MSDERTADKRKERLQRIMQAMSGGGGLVDPIQQAADAFEADMQPVCNAVVEALQAGDLHALKGLRALLPHLLEEINESPALADVLAHQLGASLLKGLNARPEELL